ncbi:hypothetical protein D3C87_2037100 [compost metagenome]
MTNDTRGIRNIYVQIIQGAYSPFSTFRQFTPEAVGFIKSLHYSGAVVIKKHLQEIIHMMLPVFEQRQKHLSVAEQNISPDYRIT